MQKSGLKTIEWDPMIQIRVNMVFGKVYSTQVGLVMNMMNSFEITSFSYYLDDILYSVVRSTASDI